MPHPHTYRLAPALALGLLAGQAANADVADAPVEGYFPVLLQESLLNGYDFEFVIHNCSDAELTGIYFEQGWDNLFSGSAFDRNLRTDPNGAGFIEGDVAPAIASWTTSLVSYEIGSGLNGLENGSSATVAFVLDTDLAFQDVQDALFTDGYGIGLQVVGYNDDGASSFFAAGGEDYCGFFNTEDGSTQREGDDSAADTTSAPSPSAALLGLAMLGLVNQRRRRGA